MSVKTEQDLSREGVPIKWIEHVRNRCSEDFLFTLLFLGKKVGKKVIEFDEESC